MDKLIVDSSGKTTISNDGATIMKQLDIVHPAAKTLTDIAKSQDAEVGDGTTTVVLLASEFLKQCKAYVEEGIHPQVIIRSLRKAVELAVGKIREIAVTVQKGKEQRELLERCAMTTLSSKLIAGRKEFFARMVVDAVMQLDELLPLNMIGIKKVQGGALEDSMLVSGVAFKKTFSYAGFEMQPKKYENPKIALLNVELELKAERDNAETRTVTIILRGGAEQFIDETERSLHDAIMIVRRALKNDAVVAGGGAIEMELSKHLRDYSRSVAGKEQLLVAAVAKALEVIPRQLCDNAGLDATTLLNKLRQRHAAGEIWAGIDILQGDVVDNLKACVWEPAVVKINALVAATEAACLILSVDETIKAPKSGGGDDEGRGRPF
ncbi:hypothetical protein HPB50_024411 [Hyalomma asiaticum]|uniref:Uncharacterized protein n=1 Tax=Hyalomma asiaticum TaxID=266040 RepID=A0ACB7SCM0_HYAAI|nr:hypothetical protein HPB50_024411 [Hyalomma asiaticum]